MSDRSDATFRIPVEGWQPPRDGSPRIGMIGDVVVGENSEAACAVTPAGFSPELRAWASELDVLVLTLDATFSGPDPKPWQPRVFAGPRCLDMLPRAKTTVVNLGNNHAFDGGSGGFRALREALHARGFVTVGAGMSREDAERPWTARVGDRTISLFVAAHAGCHPRDPLEDGGQVARVESSTWWRAIGRATFTGDDLVIALLHGGVQGSDYPSPRAIEISRRLVRVGVQVVVWTHAHVVQGIVPTARGFVAYGLGNALHPPLAGTVTAPHGDARWDTGLGLEFEPRLDQQRHASAFFVERRGLTMQSVRPSAEALARFRRVCAAPTRAGYGMWWRSYRLREDVVIPALRLARRRGLRSIEPRYLARLVRGLANARADAHDV